MQKKWVAAQVTRRQPPNGIAMHIPILRRLITTTRRSSQARKYQRNRIRGIVPLKNLKKPLSIKEQLVCKRTAVLMGRNDSWPSCISMMFIILSPGIKSLLEEQLDLLLRWRAWDISIPWLYSVGTVWTHQQVSIVCWQISMRNCINYKSIKSYIIHYMRNKFRSGWENAHLLCNIVKLNLCFYCSWKWNNAFFYFLQMALWSFLSGDMCAGNKRRSDSRTPCLEQAIHFPQFRRTCTGYNILGAVQVRTFHELTLIWTTCKANPNYLDWLNWFRSWC